MYGYFKQHTGKISLDDKDMAKKGNHKRETESLLIETQNNAIMTNYINANSKNTQQNYGVCYAEKEMKRLIAK